MSVNDKTIENLLEMDGIRFVIDEAAGLWVKFEVKRVTPTHDRPHGVRYSLSLHDRFNKRMMGFDNAHAIDYGAKTNVAPKRTYDHWHKNVSDVGLPYRYETADKLIEDFWAQVEKVMKQLESN